MADCDNTFRITSITHGATTLAQPVAFTIRENITWIKNFPGVRTAPCTALDRYELSATGTYQGHATPIVRGTSATLTGTLYQWDGGSNAYAITTMLAGAFSLNARNSSAAEASQDFEYNSGSSDNLAPISVS